MSHSQHPTSSPANALDEDGYAKHVRREMIGLDRNLAKAVRLEKKISKINLRGKADKKSVRAASSERDVLIEVK